MTRQLECLGYVQGPPGMWHHTHYLDGWPVLRRHELAGWWSADGGAPYDNPLDALEAAVAEDSAKLCRVRAARGMG